MVGKKVWVVEYDSLGFSNLNGVYSTKEKAEQSILRNLERCHWWKNFSMVDTVENNEWTTFQFTYAPKQRKILVTILMYQTEIR